MIHDKAGHSYWEHAYSTAALRKAIDPSTPGWKNYVKEAFTRIFGKLLSHCRRPKLLFWKLVALIRLGFYFVKEFGFTVYVSIMRIWRPASRSRFYRMKK